MKKINEEWLDNHISELKTIYKVLRDDSIEYLKQNEGLCIPQNQLDRVKFDDSHIQFKNEMKKYDVDLIRVIQSLFWVGRQVRGKKPRKKGYKIINTYLDNDSKDNIIGYLSRKRPDVLLENIERGLMLSGMLDRFKE